MSFACLSTDWGLYKYRHLVENLFARIKQYSAIATREEENKAQSASSINPFKIKPI